MAPSRAHRQSVLYLQAPLEPLGPARALPMAEPGHRYGGLAATARSTASFSAHTYPQATVGRSTTRWSSIDPRPTAGKGLKTLFTNRFGENRPLIAHLHGLHEPRPTVGENGAHQRHPHMFVAADGGLVERICAVELFDSLSVERARELAGIHHEHPLGECLVLQAALALLCAENPAAADRNDDCQRNFPMFHAEVCELWPRTCSGRSGPSRRLSLPPEDWIWHKFGDSAGGVVHSLNRIRLRRRSVFARPNIWRLSILMRLTWPSTGPLLQGRVRPAVTAS